MDRRRPSPSWKARDAEEYRGKLGVSIMETLWPSLDLSAIDALDFTLLDVNVHPSLEGGQGSQKDKAAYREGPNSALRNFPASWGRI